MFTFGQDSLSIAPLKFEVVGGGHIATLDAAFSRYASIMFPHAMPKKKYGKGNHVTTVQVKVVDPSEAYPQLSTDESYTLDIPSVADVEQGHASSITITANTVYGALHGLESLSQIVVFDYDEKMYQIVASPVHVEDAPRYPHRGLLLDTSRHYQPIPMIQKVIDSLAYAKFNVFHWHVVDTESFPFESRTYPRLWEGAYTKAERYTQEDIYGVVEYARLRGVKVMIEFDMPGHAGSWCAGYPEICPSQQCKQPLNPASNATFPLITSLLQECTGQAKDGEPALFPYELLHLGGDEVSYSCWETSSEIQAWEAANNLNGSEDTYKYFVDQAATITRQLSRTPVQWVEVFEHFGSTLDKNTIVHVWKEKTTLNGVVEAGYKTLLSNQDSWYLDHLGTTWQTMYINEPTDTLPSTSSPETLALIMGGETCMWAEKVDPSDMFNTIWPRAAAVAEVLWSPQAALHPDVSNPSYVDWETVQNRLETFRCLLTQRGIAAAPVLNSQARSAPPSPGSCYVQRRR